MKVFAIAALSLDGYIDDKDDSVTTSWTTKADTKFFVAKTKEAGTVIMGRKTFSTFNKPLPGRRLIIVTHSPDQISMEGVEPTSESPEQLIKRLENEGTQSVAIGGGASIYSQYVKAGLIQEFYFTIIPKFLGSGIKLFSEEFKLNLELIDSSTLDDGQTALLHYKINQLD